MNQDRVKAQDEEELKLEDISSESPIRNKHELYNLPRPTFEVNPTGLTEKRVSTPQTGTNLGVQAAKHSRDFKSLNSSSTISDQDVEIPKI